MHHAALSVGGDGSCVHADAQVVAGERRRRASAITNGYRLLYCILLFYRSGLRAGAGAPSPRTRQAAAVQQHSSTAACSYWCVYRSVLRYRRPESTMRVATVAEAPS